MSERKSDKKVGESSNTGLSKVQMDELFGHFTRVMRDELEPINERMSRLEVSTSGKNPRREKEEDDYEYEMGGEEESQNENWGRDRRGQDLVEVEGKR